MFKLPSVDQLYKRWIHEACSKNVYPNWMNLFNQQTSTFDLLIRLQMTNIHQTLTIPTVICMMTFLLSTEVTSAMEMTVTLSMGMTVV
jgi:hypothetical protein